MQFLLLLRKKARGRLKSLQSWRRLSAQWRPPLLRLGWLKIGRPRLGPSKAVQWTLGQSTPGLSKDGQSHLDPRLVTLVLAPNAGQSRAGQIRADRIREAPTLADQTSADRN